MLEKLRSEKQRPTRDTDDYTFMRRAYLKIIGRIPNKAEIDEFKNEMRGNKLKLINKLLDSEGYISHQLNYYSDILRIQNKLNDTNINSGFRYREFVRNEIRNNTPFDVFVQKLIASEGAYYEPGNEGIGFYLRDRGMPLDNLANTVQVFLGTRLECAMCHNHPFDKWTQKQFYEMAHSQTELVGFNIVRTLNSLEILIVLFVKIHHRKITHFNNIEIIFVIFLDTD